MKQLSHYQLNKYNEVSYIKRFVNGVTPKELEDMFEDKLTGGFITTLIGTHINKL